MSVLVGAERFSSAFSVASVVRYSFPAECGLTSVGRPSSANRLHSLGNDSDSPEAVHHGGRGEHSPLFLCGSPRSLANAP